MYDMLYSICDNNRNTLGFVVADTVSKIVYKYKYDDAVKLFNDGQIVSGACTYNNVLFCTRKIQKPAKSLEDTHIGEWHIVRYAGNKMYVCRCSCGVTKLVDVNSLRRGMTKSCGHNKNISMKNKKFGKWTVLDYAGSMYWRCRCECGVERNVLGRGLRTGSSKSCGHCIEDLKNKQFGYLTAIEYVNGGNWKCKCVCGNTCIVHGSNLKSKGTKSCGCKSKELQMQTLIGRYGEISTNRIHDPREPWQIDGWKSREQFIQIIKQFENEYECKMRIADLADIFCVTYNAALRQARKFEVLDMLDIEPTKTSKYESEIADIIESFYNGTVIKGDRLVLNGYELDIYIPEHKLAIEFNGSYWHSTEVKQDKLYHVNKTNMCNEKGIRLIHIFEYEWLDEIKRKKLIDIIKTALTDDDSKIYARNTEVCHIDNNEAYRFCDEHHLQNWAHGDYSVALKKDDNIIGVMIFGAPRFDSSNVKGTKELIRMCFSNKIIGGAEKMLAFYVNNNLNVNNIISYCDISKFTGNVYERLGFKKIERTKPGYTWVNSIDGTIVSRYGSQKNKLVKAGIGTVDETEDIIMKRNKYLKIYNCGNDKYVWKR